jgi:uncharacterized protein (TIGR03382 family)
VQVPSRHLAPHRLTRADGSRLAEFTPRAARDVTGVFSEGRLVYRDVDTDTDVIVTGAASYVESFWVLHSARAPRRFEWALHPGPGVEFLLDAEGSGRFVSSDGATLLELERPRAFDAAGREYSVSVSWRDGLLAFESSLDGASWPVVVDPTFILANGTRTSPPQRANFCMAVLNGRIYAFGGRISGGYGGTANRSESSTWVFENNRWRPVVTATAPPRRQDCALARFGSELILFGGAVPPFPSGSTVYLSDTWRFDGTNWTALSPAASPPARSRHVMGALTINSAERLFLFGGVGASGATFTDTWEWTGTTWVQLTPTVTPAPGGGSALSHGYVMASEPFQSKLVMFGHTSDDQLWEFDGQAWVGRRPATRPAARNMPAVAVLGSRVVVFGGNIGGGPGGVTLRDETWEWDGAAWTQRTPSTRPWARDSASAVTLQGKVVLHAGRYTTGTSSTSSLSDTWEWDGTTWTELAATPASRAFGVRGYAVVRVGDDLLLVGGSSLPYEAVAPTWRYRNGAWQRLAPPASPPERVNHAMAVLGNSVVLFGGRTASSSPLDDTWVWDGSSWSQRSPATSPPSRFFHGAGLWNGDVLVFGGTENASTFQYRNDLWAWSGTNWQLLTPATSTTTWAVQRASAFTAPQGLGFLLEGSTPNPGANGVVWDGTDFNPLFVITPLTQDGFSQYVYGPVGQAPEGLVLMGAGNQTVSPSFAQVSWLIQFATPDGGTGTDGGVADDGGTPTQDGGAPAQDAGTPTQDAGTPTQDAGTPAQDAGTPAQDAGTPEQDAGTPSQDAGTPSQDAGTPTQDAGTPTQDAGTPTQDAGTPTQDAGTPTQDAGTPSQDAGTPSQDAGTSPADGGTGSQPGDPPGCGCQGVPGSAWLMFVPLLVAGLRRRRVTVRLLE